ncbi:MAG: BBP7 family outer membrane beta-barrel protein [Scytolyngbya sp. HA4215-MV1]|jgi:hypothetical protein|nr:BBP7 family outer membrane beta-barrel protein [Scytolyngbya sp. HA4215-MV1]
MFASLSVIRSLILSLPTAAALFVLINSGSAFAQVQPDPLTQAEPSLERNSTHPNLAPPSGVAIAAEAVPTAQSPSGLAAVTTTPTVAVISEPVPLKPAIAEQQPSTLKAFQQYPTQANALAPDRQPIQGTRLIAQDASETEAPKPARPATARLGSSQKFSFEAEALFLDRDIKDVDTTADIDTGKVFGTDDLNFGMEAGARLTVGYHPTPENSFEVSFFGFQEFSDSATFTSSDFTNDGVENLNPTFNADPLADTDDEPDDFSQAFQHKIKYTSDITNLELNYRQQITKPESKGYASWLVGLRYFNINEGFDLISFDGAPGDGEDVGTYKIETDNDMFGLQIGLDAGTQLSSNLGIGLKLRTGVLLNFSDQNSKLVNTGFAGQTVIQGDARGTGISPMIELGLSATWDLSPNISLKAGYNLLFLGQVALAPEQFAQGPDLGTEFSRLDRSSALYHGPSIGIVARF